MTLNQYAENRVQFGLGIPQGWAGGDLPLWQGNNQLKQYEFSKSPSIVVDEIGSILFSSDP